MPDFVLEIGWPICKGLVGVLPPSYSQTRVQKILSGVGHIFDICVYVFAFFLTSFFVYIGALTVFTMFVLSIRFWIEIAI